MESVKGYEGLYSATMDGQIYSHRKNRYLKPGMNNSGYLQVLLTDHEGARKGLKVHRLVLLAYNFTKNIEGKEAHHVDHNKLNNHIANLRWVTHLENIQEARKFKNWKSGRKPGFKQTEETKQKMRLAKNKPITVRDVNNKVILKTQSIQETLDTLNIYRQSFNRSMNSGKPYKGYYFSFE